ncbi:hypothetical protein ACEPPN_005967 [Leptodophora sp. 'Broadleaf-Isolate-01']
MALDIMRSKSATAGLHGSQTLYPSVSTYPLCGGVSGVGVGGRVFDLEKRQLIVSGKLRRNEVIPVKRYVSVKKCESG